MSVTEMVGLFAAALAAGAINAVAGGGTLITFPTLLYFGTPPLVANATSTLGLLIGTAGSVFGFRSHLGAVKPWLLQLTPVSLAGGLLGSALLTRTTDRVFSKLIPFLILFATLLFLMQGMVARWIRSGNQQDAQASARSRCICLIAQFLLSIYGGYFGAGIGILMLASFAFLGLRNIHEMNTLKTVLGSLLNLVAAVWFVAAGLIHWPKAAALMLGGVTGYYLGSHYSQKIPQIWVRRIVTAVGLGLSGLTFYREFVR
ncbi:MAG: sulfite exporter TauE/SafE family protein [Verrucomicrobia bacterium]|nr:sulfite exporter TauE/SafE family protein [Verrucomicrobiota bacterium]MBI3869968.1 sulfite exporter TauE/SafE family protein [Verrucomicrobiota bacterium]